MPYSALLCDAEVRYLEEHKRIQTASTRSEPGFQKSRVTVALFVRVQYVIVLRE